MKKTVFCFLTLTILISMSIISEEIRIKPIDIQKLKWKDPVKVKVFDTDVTSDSFMTTVCWSPDEAQIYIQSVIPERKAVFKRFLINADGSGLEEIDRDPDWAGNYWYYKSSLESPDTDAKIEEETDKKALAIGGRTGGYGGTMMGTINIYRYKFHGDRIFEKKEVPIIAGECHSWAPKGGQAMIYTDHKGTLYIIGADGSHKTKMAKGSWCFPCWSPSGKNIAVFETDKGGKKWTLFTMEVEGIGSAGEEKPAG